MGNKEEENKKLKKELLKAQETIKSLQNALTECENKYKTLTEQIPVGIYRSSKAGKILYANPALVKILGFDSLEELYQANVKSFFADPTIRKKQLIEWQSEDRIHKDELLFRKKNGELIWVRDTGRAIPNEDGELDYFDGILEDITEYKRMIDQIQESEEKFRHLAELLPEVVFEVNDKMEFTFINQAALKRFGYSRDEMFSQNFLFQVIAKEDIGRIKQSLARNLAGESLSGNEYKAVKKDGTVCYLKTYSTHIIKNDKIIGIRGIAIDITDQKRARELLTIAKERAEQADQLKSAFLANMSHEIRTPLNSIIGFSHLLYQKKYDENKRKRYSEIIQHNGKVLLKLIDDIIDISKIESNQIKITKNAFSINSLFEQLYEIFDYEIKNKHKKDIILKFNCSLKDEHFKITTDYIRLRQILSNLINNSIKFTHEGSIEFGYELLEFNQIKFYVKDTGVGIPVEKLEIIFNRFIQVDGSETREYGGTGLGLAISRGLVNKLGGNIWAESSKNKGSIFYFTLPLYISEDRLEEPVKEQQKKGKWKTKRIILVEDNEHARVYFTELLNDTGIKIINFERGKDALEYIREHKNYHLILVDLRLPDADGIELIGEMRHINAHIPIVAQTAYSMAEDRQRCFDAGCDDYLTKPIEEEAINRVLNKYLG